MDEKNTPDTPADPVSPQPLASPQKNFVPWLIFGGILLVVVFWFGSNYFTAKNEKPLPTPTPVVKTTPAIIPDWQSFSNIDFGVAFQHPPDSDLYVGTDQITNDPQALVDLKEKCEDETSTLFSVTKSPNPPQESILNQMTEKIVVDNYSGISTPVGQTQRILVTMPNTYYLVRFTTCDPELAQQILSTFDFLQ